MVISTNRNSPPVLLPKPYTFKMASDEKTLYLVRFQTGYDLKETEVLAFDPESGLLQKTINSTFGPIFSGPEVSTDSKFLLYQTKDQKIHVVSAGNGSEVAFIEPSSISQHNIKPYLKFETLTANSVVMTYTASKPEVIVFE